MRERPPDLDVVAPGEGPFGVEIWNQAIGDARGATNPRVRALPAGISAIVPVYRSAAILPELHERLSAALSSLADRYEIILVEDAGGDESWSVIERLAEHDPAVRGMRMSRNYGQHNALLCGIRAAHYAVVVTLDDDLQNPPEEIGKLIVLRTGRRPMSSTGSFGTRAHGSQSWRCRVPWAPKRHATSAPFARSERTFGTPSRPMVALTSRLTFC